MIAVHVSKDCYESPCGKLITNMPKSSVSSPHLGLLVFALLNLVQMLVPGTHKLHCCLKVFKNFLLIELISLHIK